MANTKARTKSKWTVMVYLAGDNNLAAAGSVDLKEMKKVGSSPEVSIVAQFDSALKHHTTARYYLRKGTTLAKDLVKQMGATDCGDPNVLLDFVKWASVTYPAERYMLVLWNHGNGWNDEDIYRLSRTEGLTVTRRDTTVEGSGRNTVPMAQIRNIATRRHRRALFNTTILESIRDRGIAYDDNAKDFLDCVELKNVLQSIEKTLGQKLDILGMDACLMSMVEVLSQLKSTVHVSVASEQTEPSDGWPYDAVLAQLASNPAMTAQQFGVTIVNKYIASYGSNEGVTQACCDLEHLNPLVTAIDQLAKAMKDALATPGFSGDVMRVRQQAQSYEVEDYIDLCDFCGLLSQQTSIAVVRSACQGIVGLIQNQHDLVLASGYKGSAVENSHGISIYFPRTGVSKLYLRLDFSKATKWDEFLGSYLTMTRRPSTRVAVA